MRRDLLELALRHDEIAELDAAERRLALREVLLSDDAPDDAPGCLAELADAIDGFGPLTPLMEDESVTDVLVNGASDVWVERAGKLHRADVRFEDDEDLEAFIDRTLGRAGSRVDAAKPIADARLHDGSRVHVVLPPVATHGPLVSIRRYPGVPLSLGDLVDLGALTHVGADRLRGAVAQRETIAISGGTGSGKTTLLNALLGEVQGDERVVILEETPELRPRCAHHVSLLTRDDNIEGVGAITLADLVRATLRMRPDRIVIGEVRGPEALAALAAMSVGHDGSIVTIHARSAARAADRLVSLALLASSTTSEVALRRQVDATFDLFVHVERDHTGRRRVAEILEATTASVARAPDDAADEAF